MWLKAQPNLGQTVTYETYQLDVERAEKAPAARNDILAKRFGIPMEGYTYFFTYEETLPHRIRDFWQMRCALGADLSQGDDFCAFTFLFPLGGDKFGVKTRSYITERTLMLLHAAMRQKYEEFIREGSLHVMNGTVLDMMEVYEDLDAFIIQSESVPLGELKKLSEDRGLIFDQSLMSFAMGNAITLEDTNGNRKLLKKRQEEKIDNVAALMDAYIAFKANKETFE
jgi:phage terminase large subunit-like protein